MKELEQAKAKLDCFQHKVSREGESHRYENDLSIVTELLISCESKLRIT